MGRGFNDDVLGEMMMRGASYDNGDADDRVAWEICGRERQLMRDGMM